MRACPHYAPVLSWIKSLFHKLGHMYGFALFVQPLYYRFHRTRPNAVIICSSAGQSFPVLPLGVKSLRLRTRLPGRHASLTRVETPPLHTRAPNIPRAYSNIKLVRIEFPAKGGLCKFVSGEFVVSAEVSCCAVTSVTSLRKAKTSFRLAPCPCPWWWWSCHFRQEVVVFEKVQRSEGMPGGGEGGVWEGGDGRGDEGEATSTARPAKAQCCLSLPLWLSPASSECAPSDSTDWM